MFPAKPDYLKFYENIIELLKVKRYQALLAIKVIKANRDGKFFRSPRGLKSMIDYIHFYYITIKYF